MSHTTRRSLPRPLSFLWAALLLGMLPLATSACSASFCAGDGCNKGTIDFGTGLHQDGKNGDINITGKTDTFTLGKPITMVSHFSQNAGSKNITLEVSRSGMKRTLPYSVNSADTNVIGQRIEGQQLTSLGITTTGDYTVRFLNGSTQLAKGTFTEKH